MAWRLSRFKLVTDNDNFKMKQCFTETKILRYRGKCRQFVKWDDFFCKRCMSLLAMRRSKMRSSMVDYGFLPFLEILTFFTPCNIVLRPLSCLGGPWVSLKGGAGGPDLLFKFSRPITFTSMSKI